MQLMPLIRRLFGMTSRFESWPIVRSRPIGKTYGRAISLFINNWDCQLTTIDVYEDGSIDCGDMDNKDYLIRAMIYGPDAEQ